MIPSRPASNAWMAATGCFLLGAVATAGWAPLQQVWITWLAFAALTAGVVGARPAAQAGVKCLLFGLGLHATGHGWVHESLRLHTDAGPVWSALGAALFIMYLAAFLALPAWLCSWGWTRWTRQINTHSSQGPTETSWCQARTHVLPMALTLAVGWTAAEVLRGQLFNGFDSLAAGYLFTEWPLRGWLPVIGVYGGSLLFLGSACLAGALWQASRRRWRTSGTMAVAALAAVSIPGAALDAQSWTSPLGKPLTFRLVQGGVPQQLKFDANERLRQEVAYVEAITSEPAQLIVTPETAFTVDPSALDPALMSRLREFGRATETHVFLGMPFMDGAAMKNSVLHLVPNRPVMPRYDKTRLMPFGEFAPVGMDWFTQRMSLELDDQTPGAHNQMPFSIRAGEGVIHIGVLLCHEDLSQVDARRRAHQASLLINPGNLAWFAGTLALPQRLQVAQARALETGRPVLRTTNTGVTAHIDHRGRVIAQLPTDKPAVLRGAVQPTTGMTPFARWGNRPMWMVAFLMVLGAAVVARRASR